MGTRSSKVVQSSDFVPYSDAIFIDKDYIKSKDKIESIYAKKEVRFVSVNIREPYLTVARNNTRVVVLYDSQSHKITEIIHE